MLLDFKEIPQANMANGQQDTFEFFARDFLEAIGFEIVTHPNRGPDGGVDFIVNEKREGPAGTTKIKWLVSCKHFAHSGKSVTEAAELNILERIMKHECVGFLGFYSTIPSRGLSDILKALKSPYLGNYFDSGLIDKQVLSNPKLVSVIARHFPKSYEKISPGANRLETLPSIGSKSEVYKAVKTAMIVVEVEKIINRYFQERNLKVTDEIFAFIDRNTGEVAEVVMKFAKQLSKQLRTEELSELVLRIDSLIFNFFPTTYHKDAIDENEELAADIVSIGFDITYDCAIHLHSLYHMQYGLTFIKFAYKYAKDNNLEKVKKKVSETYDYLEQTLNRPAKDLADARKLVEIFRKDLNVPEMPFPPLPDDLGSKVYSK